MKRYVDIASVCTIIGNLFSIPYDFDRPITMDDVNESIEEIKSLPTADVVERKKIDKAIEEIQQTLYVDSLIFGELIDFKNGKISEDDVIEEFNRVTRIEVLNILKRNIGEE